MMITLPGKDAPLDLTINTLSARLQALGFIIEQRSWLNPVAGVWSVHIRDTDCPALFTNGKGNSREAALASALGEFFERLSCRYFWNHYYLGETIAQASTVHYPTERWFPVGKSNAWPKGLLTPELCDFYDPDSDVEKALLVDRNTGARQRGICAIPYTRHHDNKTVYFPVSVLASLYVSNGMAAGNTAQEARTQALSEVLERYVKFDVIRNSRCLPDIPQQVIESYPSIAQGIAELRAAGFGILVKDASLGGVYPVVNVTLLNPHDQGCFASFGAHPQFSVALERALTELLQGRALDALHGFHAPGFDQEEIADDSNLEIHFVDSSGVMSWEFLRDSPDYAWTPWDFSGTTTEEFDHLCQLIEAKKHHIYIADYDDLGVYACRIVVPGMSEIYPVDDLEWENPSAANGVRSALLNLHALDAEACLSLLDQIENLSVPDHQLVAAWLGLLADADSMWANLRMGELKTLLALAADDHDAVQVGCEWIRQFEHVPAERQRVYRCINDMLNLEDPDSYQPGLDLLYGGATVRQALDMIAGKARFFNLDAPGLDLQGCEMHQHLLTAYRKISPWLSPG